MGTPMPKPNKRPKTLTFSINYFSEEEGELFEGEFTAKRPTVGMQARIAVETSRVLDGEPIGLDESLAEGEIPPEHGVPEYAVTTAEMLGFLRVVITDAPDWWKGESGKGGDDIYDFGLLTAIYREAVKVDPFRKRTILQQFPEILADGGSGVPRDSESDSSGAHDLVADLVSEQIP